MQRQEQQQYQLPDQRIHSNKTQQHYIYGPMPQNIPQTSKDKSKEYAVKLITYKPISHPEPNYIDYLISEHEKLILKALDKNDLNKRYLMILEKEAILLKNRDTNQVEFEHEYKRMSHSMRMTINSPFSNVLVYVYDENNPTAWLFITENDAEQVDKAIREAVNAWRVSQKYLYYSNNMEKEKPKGRIMSDNEWDLENRSTLPVELKKITVQDDIQKVGYPGNMKAINRKIKTESDYDDNYKKVGVLTNRHYSSDVEYLNNEKRRSPERSANYMMPKKEIYFEQQKDKMQKGSKKKKNKNFLMREEDMKINNFKQQRVGPTVISFHDSDDESPLSPNMNFFPQGPQRFESFNERRSWMPEQNGPSKHDRYYDPYIIKPRVIETERVYSRQSIPPNYYSISHPNTNLSQATYGNHSPGKCFDCFYLGSMEIKHLNNEVLKSALTFLISTNKNCPFSIIEVNNNILKIIDYKTRSLRYQTTLNDVKNPFVSGKDNRYGLFVVQSTSLRMHAFFREESSLDVVSYISKLIS